MRSVESPYMCSVERPDMCSGERPDTCCDERQDVRSVETASAVLRDKMRVLHDRIYAIVRKEMLS